jgi:hypothetical protein
LIDPVLVDLDDPRVTDLSERVVLALEELGDVGPIAQLRAQALEHHVPSFYLVVGAVYDRHAAARELAFDSIAPRDLLPTLGHGDQYALERIS